MTTVSPTGRMPRRLLRRIDPFAVVVGVVSLVTFALHGTAGYLSRDLGIYAYAGQQVADGVPPYEGVLNRAGPLAHLLPGLGAVLARLVGIDDLLGMRLLFMLFAVGSVILVYLLGRELFETPWVGLASAAAFLSFSGFIQYASNGPREKTPMVFFLLVALLAAARRRWLVAGLFLGVATLVLQIVFFVGAPALVVAALVGERGRARLTACLRIAAGGAVALAATVLYFAVVGALDDFVQAYLLINARYTSTSPVHLDRDWRRLVSGYGASSWALVGGLLALPATALVAHRRSDRAAPLLTGMSVAAAVGVVWTVRDFDSWPDAFPLLPLAALGAGGVVAALMRLLDARAGIALAVACSLVATAFALSFSVGERSTILDVQRQSVDGVLDPLPADASIVSIQAPQTLVLTGKRNPTRHQMFASGLDDYVDDTWPGGLAAFQRSLVESQPDLVAIGRPRIARWRRAIKEDYVTLGCAPGWTWFGRRSLGPAMVARLRAAMVEDCSTVSSALSPRPGSRLVRAR